MSALRIAFFRSGVTAVILKDVGTVEEEKEKLMMWMMINRRISRHWFIIWVGTELRQ